jgi:hypothetical protein
MNTMPEDDGGEIVQFPVPRRYLPIVVQALANAMNPGAPPAPSDPSPAPAVDGHPFGFVPPPTSGGTDLPAIPWTLEDLRALSPIVSARPVLQKLFDLTAAEPDVPISFPDLVEKAEASRGQARAALAGLTQHVRRRFKRANWPVVFEWGLNGDAQAHYRMTPEVAELWRQL